MTLEEIRKTAERTANDNSIVVQLVTALEQAQEENKKLQKQIEEINADSEPETAG